MIKTRIRIPLLALLACVAPVAAAPPAVFNPASPWGRVVPFSKAQRVAITIRAPRTKFITGAPIPVAAAITNGGKVAFLFNDAPQPSLRFFGLRITFLRTGRRPGYSRGSPRPDRIYSGGMLTFPVHPGKMVNLPYPLDAGRYADMTMPGKYSLQMVAGKFRSNRLAVEVLPPGQVASGTPAIVPADISRPHLNREGTRFVVTRLRWNKKRRRLEVRARRQQRDGSHPLPSVWVFFRNGGRANASLRPTGDPFLDFCRIRVAGPDGINGDHLVAKPKPHHAPIPNWKQVPLTAYGKWLLKHPPKKMPEKSYTLKPGVVYKYAVPINLSCQYDMSLAGVYHVRVELAHPKIWSNWINIKVP